jgi:hypothetical protein
MGDDGKREYSRVFLVIVDNKHDDGEVVLAAPGLPMHYEIYATATTTNPRAACIERTPEQMSRTWHHWEVTCLYREMDAEVMHADRRLHLPKTAWRPSKMRVPAVGVLRDGPLNPDDDDIYEEPICNSFGDEFNPQPMIDTSRGVLVITRNQSAFSPAIAEEYEDAINVDPFFGAQPRTFKISIECGGREEQNLSNSIVFYYPTTYTLEFREEGWDIRQLDRGPSYYKWDKPKEKEWEQRFVDRRGYAKPYGLLNGNGYALIDSLTASTGVSTTASTFQEQKHAVYIRKRPHKLRVFSALNLPQEFI